MKAIVKENRKVIDVVWYDELPDDEGNWFNIYKDTKTGIVYTEFEIEMYEYYGG
jgi:hypothetical protein